MTKKEVAEEFARLIAPTLRKMLAEQELEKKKKKTNKQKAANLPKRKP